MAGKFFEGCPFGAVILSIISIYPQSSKRYIEILSSKRITPEEALIKLQRYCAYQDRCHQEVRGKLLDMEIYGDTLEAIMAELIAEDFLNEERFARSYARGKFRLKQWGRLRIVRELKKRAVTDYCIRKALGEIEEEEYRRTLEALLARKLRETGEADAFQLRGKMARYAIGRGFEPELVWAVVMELAPGEE